MTEKDVREIIEFVHHYCDVVSHGDGDDFRALWLGRPDDTMISLTSDFHGVDAVVDDFLVGLIRRLYDSIELIEDDVPDVRPIDDDTAVVVFRYHTEVIRSDTKQPDGIVGIETQVVRRTPEGWRYAHIHYSKK